MLLLRLLLARPSLRLLLLACLLQLLSLPLLPAAGGSSRLPDREPAGGRVPVVVAVLLPPFRVVGLLLPAG